MFIIISIIINVPVKTLDNLPGSSTLQQRRTIVRHDAPSTSTASASRAKKAHSFDDLKTYFKREYLYLHGWTVNVSDTDIIVEMRKSGYCILFQNIIFKFKKPWM